MAIPTLEQFDSYDTSGDRDLVDVPLSSALRTAAANDDVIVLCVGTDTMGTIVPEDGTAYASADWVVQVQVNEGSGGGSGIIWCKVTDESSLPTTVEMDINTNRESIWGIYLLRGVDVANIESWSNASFSDPSWADGTVSTSNDDNYLISVTGNQGQAGSVLTLTPGSWTEDHQGFTDWTVDAWAAIGHITQASSGSVTTQDLHTTNVDDACSTVAFPGTSGAGEQTLTPGLTQNLAVTFAPTVTVGAVTLTPPLTQNLAVTFAPVVTGLYPITPPLTQNLATTFAPTVTTGAVTVTPPLTQQLATTFAPTVTVGSVSLTPPLTQRLAVTFAPVVTLVQSLTPPLTQNLAVTFAPTVTTGAVTITPPLTQRLAVTFAPTVTLAGTGQSLTPPLTQNLAVTFAPVVTTGSVSLTPGLTQRLAVTFAPTVTATVELTPGLTQRLAVTFAPVVTVGATSITLTLTESLAVTFPPVVSGGTLDLSAGHDTARFYRLGTGRLALAIGLGRGGATPYKRSETWARASGAFALPLGIPPTPDNDATAQVRVAWDANKADTDAVVYAAINAALTAAGYTNNRGEAII